MITKEQKLKAIYRHMHRDYKGAVNGVKMVMVLRGGSCLVPLDSLMDVEIERLWAFCPKAMQIAPAA